MCHAPGPSGAASEHILVLHPRSDPEVSGKGTALEYRKAPDWREGYGVTA